MVNILKPAGYFNYTQTLLPLIFFLLSFFISSSSFFFSSFPTLFHFLLLIAATVVVVALTYTSGWGSIYLSEFFLPSWIFFQCCSIESWVFLLLFFAQKLNIILQFDDKRKTSLYKDFYYWASESSYMEWDAIFLTIHGMI